MVEHSRISPSKLHQIISCPASLRMQESPNCPVEAPNPQAEDGTEKHAIMEGAVKSYITAWKAKCDEEQRCNMAMMHIQAMAATDQIYDLELAWHMVHEVLLRMDLNSVHLEHRVCVDPQREIYGTCDLWGFTKDDHLVILDYKFGWNPVSPEDNPQLRAYALGVANSEFFHLCHSRPSPLIYYYIIQPKVSKEALSHMDFWAELQDWAIHCWRVLDQALDQNPETWPKPTPSSDACKWCRAKAICRAYSEYANQQAAQVFSAYARIENARQEDELCDEELFFIYSKLPELEDAIRGIKKCVTQKLFNGPAHGYKLVRTRGRRGWDYVNHAELELELNEIIQQDYPNEFIELYKSVLETPPALLKKYPKLKKNKRVSDLIAMQPGQSLSIVPADDPRPAECNSPQNAFSGYLEEEGE